MVGREQMQAVGENVFGAVGEAVLRFAGDDSGFEQEGQVTVEGDLTQADDDADAREGLNFSGEVACAVADLLRVGLVSRRRAANDGGDPGMPELEAVVTGDGARLAGEA